jgi:hypothetical protein
MRLNNAVLVDRKYKLHVHKLCEASYLSNERQIKENDPDGFMRKMYLGGAALGAILGTSIGFLVGGGIGLSSGVGIISIGAAFFGALIGLIVGAVLGYVIGAIVGAFIV